MKTQECLHSIHLATGHRATDPRINKEAQTLAEAGRRVTVVLPHEESFSIDGVRIEGVRLPVDGRDRLLRTTGEVVRRALQVASNDPNTVFHIHESELLLHGLRLASSTHRVVYDAHEDSPRQALHQEWVPRMARRPYSWSLSALEALGGRWFEGIIAAVPQIANRYPEQKTALIRNYPRLSDVLGSGGEEYSRREPRTLYVGSISEARGLREMMSAMAQVPVEIGARLHLVGDVHPSNLRDEAASWEGADQTIFHGYQQRSEVAVQLEQARIGMVVLQPTPQYLRAYPTKLFEYMGAGLPVIASDFPIIRQFIEPYRCGMLVDPEDSQAIAEAIRWLLEHVEEAEAMGQRGRQAVQETFNWAPEGEALLAFYEALDQGRSPGQTVSGAYW